MSEADSREPKAILQAPRHYRFARRRTGGFALPTFLMMAAACLAAASPSNPMTAENFRPTTWDTRKLNSEGAEAVGRDTLDGGLGNDELHGGGGNDTYLFGRNAGQDTLYDSQGTDVLRLGTGILPSDVFAYGSVADLVLTLTSPVGNAECRYRDAPGLDRSGAAHRVHPVRGRHHLG